LVFVKPNSSIVIASHAQHDEAIPFPILKFKNFYPMKTIPFIIFLTLILATACTSQQKLAYLNNLPEAGG